MFVTETERKVLLVMNLKGEVIPSVSLGFFSLYWFCVIGCLDWPILFVCVFFQNGLNALHLAAKEGHVDLVQELLDRGAPVDSATKVGYFSLSAEHVTNNPSSTWPLKLILPRLIVVNNHRTKTLFFFLFCLALSDIFLIPSFLLPLVTYHIDFMKKANNTYRTSLQVPNTLISQHFSNKQSL